MGEVNSPVKMLAISMLLGSWTPGIAADRDQAVDLIERMSAAIASLDSFAVTGDGYVDARLDDGHIVEHSMDADFLVRKPGSMRLRLGGAEASKQLYVHDGTLTLSTTPPSYFAREDVAGDIATAASYAIDELGIDALYLFAATRVTRSGDGDTRALEETRQRVDQACP